MINKIKRFFETHLAPESSAMERDPQHALQLAVAVLLFEVAESDYRQHPDEKRALLAAVRSHFQLSTTEADELLALAETEHADATDYFQFTRLINQHYSPPQKVQLVEALWQVAFSDQQLHHYEEHVIRRLAELLYVPHDDFIAAKHRASQLLG
ncbi:TerB family tellurite resistance protein [Sedimenticola sp.]|uniref:tellurite resistance TerB family protein n=1 Tax=Sedimenticola sp. TaxID=1940285 RepID=UPI003D0AAFE6